MDATHLRLHPVTETFPRMRDDEFSVLVEDIRRHGVRQPILVHEGQILDGRHRWEAAQQLGIECPTVKWDGEGPIVDVVVSLNLKRRHLTASQAAAVAVGILPFYETEAKQRQGTRTDIKAKMPEGAQGQARDQAAKAFGTSGRYVEDARTIGKDDPALFQRVMSGEMTISRAKLELNRRRMRKVREARIAAPGGRFQTLVIDPPWQMEKIAREVRPRQHGFDYPTMTEDQLAALPVADLTFPDAHIYLWVTHKFLPMGLRLLQSWGFNYQCLMTWVKNVGFTPFSWMYSTEHVLFGRRGSLDLLVQGKRLDFSAKVRGHSRKPAEFYELVRTVSPGPRLDMFSRETHEGFTAWGNEVGIFDGMENNRQGSMSRKRRPGWLALGNEVS